MSQNIHFKPDLVGLCRLCSRKVKDDTSTGIPQKNNFSEFNLPVK